MPRRPTSFAGRLRELRRAAGVTPRELAGRSRLARQAVVALERGDRQPSWEAACRLARALGVTVGAFEPEAGPAEDAGRASTRLLDAARAYARAYDQVEQKSRGAGEGSIRVFARFQEAQVELNMAALDLYAVPPAGATPAATGRDRAATAPGRRRSASQA
jgi:transcriptional regulator with XRE-family HTH domain